MKTIKEIEKEGMAKIRSALSFIREYAEFLDGRLDDSALPIEEFRSELLAILNKWGEITRYLESKEI